MSHHECPPFQNLNWLLPIAEGKKKELADLLELEETRLNYPKYPTVFTSFENEYLFIRLYKASHYDVPYKPLMQRIAHLIKSNKHIYIADVEGEKFYHCFYDGKFHNLKMQFICDEIPGEIFTP